jgi:hypothetical protein
MIDRSLAALSTDPIEATEPIENADRAEPMDPIDRTEPIEPIESVEFLQPMQRNEFSERMDHREPESWDFMAPSLPGRARARGGYYRENPNPRS